MLPWAELKAEAEQVVADTLDELPPEIYGEAQKVPILFDTVCAEDPDIFGLYGHFQPGEVSTANGPIILYLEAIEDFCLAEDSNFAIEVRLTYLHELGHHLGWDEGELEERGLA